METPPRGHNSESGKAPHLRCPGCGSAVSLPAEKCPQCRYDFRTGTAADSFSESEEDTGSRRTVFVVGGLAFLLIIGVAVFVFGFGSDKKVPPASAATAAPIKTDISDVVETFQSLPNSSIGSRPGKILDMTHKTADKVEENRQLADEISHSTD